LKIDSPSDIIGCKFKIQHGSKAFDFVEDIDHNKTTKIKKIVHFIVKSETEEVDIILHKNGKVVSFCRLSTT
jgi:hypothetical protein